MSLCKGDCDTCLERAVNQPFGVEMVMADGVFIKQMIIPDAGTIVPQHAHKYDHTSLLATGSVRVMVSGKDLGVRSAPDAIFIKAGVMHMFEALEAGTQIYCIHNVSRTGSIEIEAENKTLGLG